MQTNPFPAILLAGPPHSGKSVLAHLLTEHLRQLHIPHYLLRAVPDGEGNWFHTGPLETVRLLRAQNKRTYSTAFVSHMRQAIEQRWLPLLVDIGGKPQDDQFDLIRACTHSLLLYREENDYHTWQTCLIENGLIPVAELQSVLAAPDQINQTSPVLTGSIGDLHREVDLRRVDASFDALLDCISSLLQRDEATLERIHLDAAPPSTLLERELAAMVGIPTTDEIVWAPEHLTQLQQLVPTGQRGALYGYGTVWLAAMLAAHALPAPFSFFDVRYGWLDTPTVRAQGQVNRLNVTYTPSLDGLWANIQLSQQAILEPRPLVMVLPPGNDGLILSGPLPRWAFAALTRAFASARPWVAVDEPRNKRVIVVASQSAALPVGSTLPYNTH